MNFELISTVWRQEKEVICQCEQMGEDFDAVENNVVNLYPDMTYETFESFGGAVTEAAAFVYAQMDEQQKREVVHTYFSAERMNYQAVRVHMDSCDFCIGQYEAMSDADDVEMSSFSFKRTEKYIVPMLRDIERELGHPVPLMLSPWSAPSFMKTNGRREGGGKVKEEYKDFWADYICRYISEFQQRGFTVQKISLQNEPNAVQTWDSCIWSAEEEKDFLKNHMYPALQKNGMGEIGIYVWDHNKERVFERAKGILDDEEARDMVEGVAFHWYSGDHFDALSLVRERFPEKKLIISESCLEYCKFEKEDILKNAQRLAHEIIGDLNHGMTAFYDWNLLLNEKGGPNYVNNFCHAPFLFDTKTKELMPQSTQAYFEHFSHYILPGSVRIAATVYTDVLELTAWKRPDGKIALVILNPSDQKMKINIRVEGWLKEAQLLPESITTILLGED